MQKLLISTLLCATLISGCSVHKPDIQQGNVITEEMLSRLQVGMDRRQARFVMGTPSISDPFRDNRWDYFYSLKKSRQDAETKHITLYFEGDTLVKIVEQN